MRADKIKSKIYEFISCNVYKSILIDGHWGIGKTFEVNKAIECFRNEYKFVKVSLFGIKNIDELMQECIIELIPLINNKDKDTLKSNKDIIQILTNIVYNSIDKLKNNQIITKMINPRLIFTILMNSYKKISDDGIIFVFDDLERIQKDFDITEFLGLVEKLLVNFKTKIIIIGNTNNLDENNQSIFEEFNEKIIDKIYIIDELSLNIKIDDEEFIQKFIFSHNLKNLRTIKKGNLLYKDVFNKLKGLIKDVKVMDTIKLICFSIVNENVDKTYYKTLKEEKKDDLGLQSEFCYRVLVRYMHDSPISEYNYNLIEIFNDYYTKDIEINIEYLNEIYNKLTAEKEKHNFYKSQQEIEALIDENIKKLKSNKLESIESILVISDTVLIWTKTLNGNTDELSKIIKEKIMNCMKDKIDINDELYNQQIYSENFSIQSEILEKIMEEVKLDLESIYINRVFKNTLVFAKSLDYSSMNKNLKNIKELTMNPKYKKVIYDNMKKVNIESLLPIGSITEEQYRTFQYIYKICESVEFKRIDKIINKELLIRQEDKIFKHRIEITKKHNK